MDQLVFKSKWDDDDQLPPLVEEVQNKNLDMPAQNNVLLQSQSNTYLIDLSEIGYKGTAAIVCKNDMTVWELKQMIYQKYQKYIPQPNYWSIETSEKTYKEDQLLDKIDIKSNAYNYECLDIGYGKIIKIMIDIPILSKSVLVEIGEDTYVDDLLLNLRKTEWFRKRRNEIILRYNEKVLCPKKTLKQQFVEDRSNLKLSLRCCGACFPGFAPVQLYDGSIRQIQDIQINDQVLSYDIDSKQFVQSQIIATHNSKVDQLIEILTSQQVIITTSNHPFLTEQGWKAVQPDPQYKIKNLTIQDKLLNVQNQYEQILSIEYQQLKYEITVYNITTRKPNNYIVYGYVVHNKNTINIRVNGEIDEIETILDLSILNVKVLIASKYGIDVRKIKLWNEDTKELEDFKKVEDYFSKTSIATIDVIVVDEGKQEGLEFKYVQNTEKIKSQKANLNNDCLDFTMAMREKELSNLQTLEDFFGFQKEKFPQIQPHIKKLVDDIKQNPQRFKQFQQLKIHHLVTIQLWTGNLVYKKINIDLRKKNYIDCKTYLKYLMEALRLCKYYNGQSYRGLKDYQNTQMYQVGKTLQFCEVTCISKILQIARNFSNINGMILEIDQRSSKDIQQLSLYPNEQEIILLPYSQLMVTNINQQDNEPIYVKLKELPQPRWMRVLLWVDDKPENCYPYAQELEKNHADISVVFCISTEEAIDIIERNRWMIFLHKTNLRIVTDMARIENGQLNEIAGVDFIQYMYEVAKYKNQILLFCSNTQKAILACQSKKLVGNYIISKKVEDLINFLRFQ